MKIYSITGTNEQIIDNSANSTMPNGYIEMFDRRPTEKHIAQADGTWSYPLELAKAEKWQEIKVLRDQREQEGLPYMGKVLDSDALSVQRLTTAVQAAQLAISQNQEFTINWTTKDNSVLVMIAQDVCGIPLALAQYSDSLHAKARSLKEQIAKAESLKELEKITWND